MMEIELILGQIATWTNVEDSDKIKMQLNNGLKTTGRWRLGGSGKNYLKHNDY